MPIYEFICNGCGETFETLLPSTDTKAVRCEACGGGDVKKLLSAASIKTGSGAPSLPMAPAPGCGSSGFS